MSAEPTADAAQESRRLSKRLRLVDVFAIGTGAMFSSGFFLLPGIAIAQSGPSAALAYLLAGVAVVPATLAAAELSSAMPKAGGPYYFIDRSLGPLIGMIGGVGAWFSLIGKSAFALVGMSAYLALYVDLPLVPVAVILTVLFALLNVVGVKATTRLQLVLVGFLLVVLGYFLVTGAAEVFGGGFDASVGGRFAPFFASGAEGVLATTGLVFVSYSGLMKISSMSEEVARPNRSIPLGMILSLATVTVVYVVGVLLMLAVTEEGTLADDLTPVATAASTFLPEAPGVLLIVAAAIAGFASAGNAGILSAGRYPLAMARDRMVWPRFSVLGRFHTPTAAIVATAAIMVLALVTVDVAGIAKLASAFNLLIFGLLNLAVIVMRESRIDAYDPGFRAPLYPWLPVAGLMVSAVFIFEIGGATFLATLGVVVACVVWYVVYARFRVTRDGALYHIFARLGQRRDEGLDRELLAIVQEQGLRDDDRFEEVVARSAVIELEPGAQYGDAVRQAAVRLGPRVDADAEELATDFLEHQALGATPVHQGAAMPHVLREGVENPELAIVRSRTGIVPDGAGDGQQGAPQAAYALFFLVGDKARAGRALRILAQLAEHVDDHQFLRAWNIARDEQELKEVLLQEERSLSLWVRSGTSAEPLVGQQLRDARLARGCLVALIRRGDQTIVPQGSTVVHDGDRLTIIGTPDGIRDLRTRFAEAARHTPRASDTSHS